MSATFRLILLGIAFATIASANVPAPRVSGITVVNDIHRYVAEHPNVKLTPLDRQEGIAPTLKVGYRLGQRIDGDRQLSVGYGGVDTPNVSVPLSYPENGIGSILTCVEIITTQINKSGQAYVAAGGIGQRFITIIVEAQDTEYFSFSVKYFGTD